MAESNRNSRLPQSNLPWSIHQIQQNSQHIASSATQHIHDFHHYVVQGLTPLINTASLRSVHSSHDRTSWQRSSMEFNSDQQTPTFSMPESSPQDYVIDIDSHSPEFSVQMSPDSSPVDNSVTNSEPMNNGNSTDALDANNLRSTPEFQIFMTFAEKYVPFLAILGFKLMYDHRIGILVIIGLFITFFHANTVVKREVSKQGKRRLMSLVWVFLNLAMCITIIYAVLGEDGLAYALVFVTPYTSPISVWDVMWIVSVTDFVLRMITILVKLVILAIPARLIAFQKKGKHYLFAERTSQLYRTIAPMQHWLYFFSEAYEGPSKLFGVLLSAAYLIFKCKSILSKAKLWKKTLLKVLQSKRYGVTPSVGQIKEAGESCPICQDDYKSPSMLQCKHIFCEDCVALWFDRERTCPICRAQIADDPSWRDGSTTLTSQFF